MKVGFIPFFGWRPHNQHFLYLVYAVKSLGYRTAVLKCDGSVRTCYNREIKTGAARFLACASCKMSASYAIHYSDEKSDFSDFSSLAYERHPKSSEWVASSYRTLNRAEHSQLDDVDLNSSLFRSLQHSASETYEVVSSWIAKNQIEFVFLFNGRMDNTRAALEACKDRGVQFASVERSLFNWGIQVYPNSNCLDLAYVHQFTSEFAEVPLSAEAAQFAGKILNARLHNIHSLSTEWRTYNKERVASSWPGQGDRRILLVPSSGNEIEGEPSYNMEWSSTTEGFEAVLNSLDLGSDQIVMRGHPNWSEAIGSASGDETHRFYESWCQQHGIVYVPPSSRTDTNSLIQECDLVVLSHSSAVLEAIGLSKPVINIRPAMYSSAKISLNMRSRSELEQNIGIAQDFLDNGYHSAQSAQRYLLRFLFTMAKRIPLFPNTARPNGPAGSKFFKSSDTSRLRNIIENGELLPEVYQAGFDTRNEDQVLLQIADRSIDSTDLAKMFEPQTTALDMPHHFKMAEAIRARFRQGDR